MDFQQELLNILIQSMDEGIQVVDTEGNTIIYNNAMAELEGLEKEEVLGKKLLEVFPSLDANTSTLIKTLASGEAIPNRYQTYINKKGYPITAVNTTIPLVVEGKLLGAVEIAKDFTKVKELYDRILHLTKQEARNAERTTIDFSNMIGCSPKFLRVVEMAQRASRSSSSLLIYGETGTGKEVLARCIHLASSRSEKPFIAINCAAIPGNLLEGLLFGTVKGSFTGALNRPGFFEQANGGTILLDEINSMSVELQTKLLRVLQESYVRRVGDVKDIRLDVRVIATTNEEPFEAIEGGRLRRDLYYRISVINLTLPPLKERKEDIPLFIKEFIQRYNEELGKEVWDVSTEVLQAFMSYSWPGNVRELKNYIEGSMNLATSHILNTSCLTTHVQNVLFGKTAGENKRSVKLSAEPLDLDKHMQEEEKGLIQEMLEKCGGNISETARMLGLKRQTLQHKLKKHGIV